MEIEREVTPRQQATIDLYKGMLGDFRQAMTSEGVDAATVHRVTMRLIWGDAEGPRTVRKVVEHAPLVARIPFSEVTADIAKLPGMPPGWRAGR
jgi:hypothetical protein